MSSSNNNVSLFTKSTNTQGANLGGVKSPGHKKMQNQFIVSHAGSNKSGISYVKTTTRTTVSEQGNISTGALDSDIAIEGSGMLLVSKTATGEKVFTRRGDFQKDKSGYWKNGGDMLLLAWKLGTDGKLPTNSTLLSSLEAVNFANVKGTPVATTTVSLAMNLDGRLTTDPIRGAGFTAKLKTAGLNQSTNSSNIIFPEDLGNGGSMALGDSFTFTSTPPGTAKSFVYGGIAVSNLINPANAIYGARSATEQFTGMPPLFVLDINGTHFSYKVGNPSVDNKEFNSFSTLAAALNKTGEFIARIDTNGTGRLYIAPKDPNTALNFTGINGIEVPANLGLFNVAAKLPGAPDRFYSLDTLQKAVNATAGDASLKATIANGAIQITSKLATSAFTLNANSFGVRNFTTIIRGDGTEKGRAGISILSPAHGLQPGDLVRITGLGGQTPDGIYAVGRTFGPNGQNSFEIFVLSDDPRAAPGGGVAAGLPAAVIGPIVATPAPGSWQKVPGTRFAPVAIAPGTVVLNANIIRINDAANTVADNDIVYIKDFGAVTHAGANLSVPDGYYVVSNRIAGSFDIIPAYNSANAGVSPVPAAFAPALGNFSYQKVGFTAGAFAGPNDFDTNVLVTTGGVGSNRVKLLTTSNLNYSANDYIVFDNLPAAGLAVDGITVQNGVRYKVVVNSTVDFVTFEVDGGVATTGDDATGVEGYVAASDPAALPAGFRVNNVTKALKYLDIARPADQQNNAQVAQSYAAVYIPDDVRKNLKALLDSNKFPSESVLLTEVDVFDSIGDTFALQFRFAKLDKGKWAVSVGLKPDTEGNYADPAYQAKGGQIAFGEILFDENGQYVPGTGISNVLSITRQNNSATSTITIDWANQLNDKTSATMSQFANPNNVEPSQQNGRGSGTLLDNGLSVDEEGFIIGTFDNGDVVKLYQIPIAMFANINGLLEVNDGTYRITGDSGPAFLKAAGQGGAGQVIGRALEDSNADTTDELLEVQDTANVIRANARVASVKFSNIATVLSELKQ